MHYYITSIITKLNVTKKELELYLIIKIEIYIYIED